VSESVTIVIMIACACKRGLKAFYLAAGPLE